MLRSVFWLAFVFLIAVADFQRLDLFAEAQATSDKSASCAQAHGLKVDQVFSSQVIDEDELVSKLVLVLQRYIYVNISESQESRVFQLEALRAAIVAELQNLGIADLADLIWSWILDALAGRSSVAFDQANPGEQRLSEEISVVENLQSADQQLKIFVQKLDLFFAEKDLSFFDLLLASENQALNIQALNLSFVRFDEDARNEFFGKILRSFQPLNPVQHSMQEMLNHQHRLEVFIKRPVGLHFFKLVQQNPKNLIELFYFDFKVFMSLPVDQISSYLSSTMALIRREQNRLGGILFIHYLLYLLRDDRSVSGSVLGPARDLLMIVNQDHVSRFAEFLKVYPAEHLSQKDLEEAAFRAARRAFVFQNMRKEIKDFDLEFYDLLNDGVFQALNFRNSLVQARNSDGASILDEALFWSQYLGFRLTESTLKQLVSLGVKAHLFKISGQVLPNLGVGKKEGQEFEQKYFAYLRAGGVDLLEVGLKIPSFAFDGLEVNFLPQTLGTTYRVIKEYIPSQYHQELLNRTDKDGNTFLHLAAKMVRSSALSNKEIHFVSGTLFSGVFISLISFQQMGADLKKSNHQGESVCSIFSDFLTQIDTSFLQRLGCGS